MRGCDCFVLQSTCAPANTHLMELLIMIDALRRSSARRITAVVPYYGYARQDRKVAPRLPITAKLVADLISTAGTDRLLCIDLHAGQIQGFFNIPVDNLFATPVLLRAVRERISGDVTIISPDAGGVERARAYAKRLDASLAIIDKRRERANESQVMNIIGEVKGRTCVIVDDIVDTAGTLTEAARALESAGAAVVLAASRIRCSRAPRSSASRVAAARARGHRHHPAAPGGGDCEKMRVVRCRSSSARRSAASTTRRA